MYDFVRFCAGRKQFQQHGVTLAFEFCDRAYVLQYGRVAMEGRVAELREADLVRRIYLGKEAVAA